MNFRRNIYTLNKAIEGSKSIKVSAMDLLNEITVGMLKSIARQASDLCEHGNSKVLNHKTLEAATKMFLPGEMSKYAIKEAQAAVLKFQQYEKPT